MEDCEAIREVVGHFFKDSGKRVWLNSLTVFRENAQFDASKPYVLREEWDVYYSRKFGYLFNMSGAGGDESVEVQGLYHVTVKTITQKLLGKPLGALRSPKIVEKESRSVDARDDPPFDNQPRTQAIRKRNLTRKLFTLPKSFDVEEGKDLLDWLEHHGICCQVVYCSICKDFFPDNDWDSCEHSVYFIRQEITALSILVAAWQ